MHRPFPRLFLATLATLAVLVGCDRRLGATECEALIDRYIELSLGPPPATLPAGGFGAWVLAGLERGRERDAYRPRVVQCQAEVTVQRGRCGMRAHTQGEWEACM